MVQEYGRYFGMKTCALRGCCLTVLNHSGVDHSSDLTMLMLVRVFEAAKSTAATDGPAPD